MNKMEKALSELGHMDELAVQESPVHGMNATAKLLSTVIYILIVMSFDKYDLSGLIPMVLWPVLLYQMSGIPVRTCFYKLRIVLPLVMAVGLFNPFFDREILLHLGNIGVSGGMISMITLMLKGVFCLMASFPKP
jgi:cobalt/nickel transport system permease protein